MSCIDTDGYLHAEAVPLENIHMEVAPFRGVAAVVRCYPLGDTSPIPGAGFRAPTKDNPPGRSCAVSDTPGVAQTCYLINDEPSELFPFHDLVSVVVDLWCTTRPSTRDRTVPDQVQYTVQLERIYVEYRDKGCVIQTRHSTTR